jgi:4,5-DOPA dioxygenase extradiol
MSSDLLSLSQFQSLRPSERLPVVFLGHGSPMNAITDNAWRDSWRELGQQFGQRWPRPQLILCISAHWLTEGWWLTAMARPRTIHDFGGFPQELFDQQYPAPGWPEAAQEIGRHVRQRGARPLGLDVSWGLDHGAWAVLKPMFPQADVPVIQLSMDYSRAPQEHFELAGQLRGLRDRGVLILGSGNTVHNLRMMQRQAPNDQAYDWTVEFDQTVAEWIAQGQLERLARFLELGSLAQMAQPSHEHFLPLLYAAAAAHPGEAPRFFNEDFQGASIAMRSVIWGEG